MTNDQTSKQSNSTSIDQQQLFVKWQLCQQTALIAKQQLAVKAGLAQQQNQMQFVR